MSSATLDVGAYAVDEVPLLRKICRASLYDFVREFWGCVEQDPFIDNWHIGAVCEHLQAVSAGEISRLLINIPPGCSKSLITSVFWPMWEWAIDPSRRWFFASYDQRLSTRDSVKCRALIASRLYRDCFGASFTLTHDQNQKTYYETDKGGYRLATSVGGHGTGEHPDRLVVDDPHNVKQAESEAERQAVIDWWDLTMSTRGVSRGARRVIIMQRLHEQDLSGHVLSQGGWVHLCFCMRHEHGRMGTTPLLFRDPRKEEGELLAPEQFPESAVKEMENQLGPYGAAGQLQQRPTPRKGGMFEEPWFSKRVKAAPYDCARVRFWDRGCLVAGTMVTTDRGDTPIETVSVGDMVLTRAGYCRVTWAGATKITDDLVRVLFSNGSVLVGTPDHRVWTEDRYWVPLGALEGGDYITSVASMGDQRWLNDEVRPVSQTQKPWCSTGSLIATGPAVVYDLTVEGEHEFFANGILVHNSTEGGGCFTAGVLMARSQEGAYYVEHVEKGQWGPAERCARMRACALRDRAKYGPRHEPVVWIEAEGGASGRDSWLMAVRALEGFTVKEYQVSRAGSKEIRAEPWSSQCAAGNVYIVDNGQSIGSGVVEWDVNSYVKEHCAFPKSTYKDQVDASSGAFAQLVQGPARQGQTLRVYRLGVGKQGQIKVVVCNSASLGSTLVEQRATLVSVQGPGREPVLPAYGLRDCCDHLLLSFADLQASQLQDRWDQPVEPYGELPEKLLMNREHGKKLWAHLLKRRDRAPLVYVFHDDAGGNIAASLALAFCDIMRLKPDETITAPHVPDNMVKGPPPNTHVYEMAKLCRGMVM